MLLTEDDHVVEAFSPYGTYQALSIGIRVGHRLHVMGTARLLPFG
jgi:hypothetical protein